MDVATCIGSGRLAELALFCENTQADMVIFDHELTCPAAQHRGTPVIPRCWTAPC